MHGGGDEELEIVDRLDAKVGARQTPFMVGASWHTKT
jgi:hypothetical protein